MNRSVKKSASNGQSAAKPLLNEEGSEIISRKESRLDSYLAEKPDIIIENLFYTRKFKKIPCIYCIFSESRRKVYIGSTNNLQRRIQRHREALRKGQHFSRYLQRVFNLEGAKDISVFTLEYVNINISEREEYWIKYFDAVKTGFNASYDTQRNFINEEIKAIIKSKNSKPVLMFTLEGELLREFDSVTAAAHYIGDQSTNISACCQEKIRWVKNRVFRYKLNFIEFNLRESKIGKFSTPHLEKILEKTAKRVICNTKVYKSISEAERLNNVPKGVLGKYIKQGKNYKGMIFNYYEDMIQPSGKPEE